MEFEFELHFSRIDPFPANVSATSLAENWTRFAVRIRTRFSICGRERVGATIGNAMGAARLASESGVRIRFSICEGSRKSGPLHIANAPARDGRATGQPVLASENRVRIRTQLFHCEGSRKGGPLQIVHAWAPRLEGRLGATGIGERKQSSNSNSIFHCEGRCSSDEPRLRRKSGPLQSGNASARERKGEWGNRYWRAKTEFEFELDFFIAKGRSRAGLLRS